MSRRKPGTPLPRETESIHSLVWATALDTLPLDAAVEQRDGYLAVRSPRNPSHYWGNLLLFDDPPGAGDGSRWEELFEAEFGDDARIRHRTFAWDRSNGDPGLAHEEFVERGYDLDESIGLVAAAGRLRAHPRENRVVVVRPLDPAAGADAELWDAVVELQVAGRDERSVGEEENRNFTRARLESLREHFRAGRGSWYVAIDPDSGRVAASCGVVVTGGRGRFQVVDTALAYRRRGIASRLVVDAAQHAASHHGAERLVIVADAGYHALGLYESLGFERAEHVFGVCRWPR